MNLRYQFCLIWVHLLDFGTSERVVYDLLKKEEHFVRSRSIKVEVFNFSSVLDFHSKLNFSLKALPPLILS